MGVVTEIQERQVETKPDLTRHPVPGELQTPLEENATPTAGLASGRKQSHWQRPWWAFERPWDSAKYNQGTAMLGRTRLKNPHLNHTNVLTPSYK